MAVADQLNHAMTPPDHRTVEDAMRDHLYAAMGLCSRIVALPPSRPSPGPISTPMSRPRRIIRPPDLEPAPVHAQRPAVEHLTLGTYARWEIIDPTETSIRSLCSELAVARIHCCCVTGLPSAGISQFLDGRYGFILKGDSHSHIQNSCLLVATPWSSAVTIVEPVGEASAERTFCILP